MNPFILESDNVVFFDVDDTLIMLDYTLDQAEDTIEIENFGYKSFVLPHKKHIELLKQFKLRGHKICVWSQGGFAWTKKVVELLNLQNDVDIIMCKPKWYVDDLPCQEFLGKPIYHKLEEGEK